MQHTEVIQKWLGKKYQESAKYGHQCVSWAKKYISEVYDLRVGPFGGSANAGWENIRNTFDPKKWKKVDYTYGKIPPVGAIIFWKSLRYGHVAVVGEGSTAEKLVIIEQNLKGSATGEGMDSIREREIDYRDTFRGRLVGWYEWKLFENEGVSHYAEILAKELAENPDYEPVYKKHDLIEKMITEIGLLRFWGKYIKK